MELEALDQLEQMIKGAKKVPMSASVMISRDDALTLVDALRAAMPREADQARQILASRDDLLAKARVEADGILEQARAERARLLSKTELVKAAEAEAARIVHDADAAGAKLKHEADDYVDAKLANFEILLAKTSRTVHR